jgi:hypothetical protein
VSQRRPLLQRLTPADRILLGGSGLLFVDSLLSWQRRCPAVGGVTGLCQRANAWGANGAVFGVLMGISAVLLAVQVLAGAGSQSEEVERWLRPGLIASILVFGVLKLLLVLGHFPGFGAWVGLILLLVLAYGGLMWTREVPASL